MSNYYLSIMSCYIVLGHGSTVQTPNGEDWYIYHAWRYKEIGNNPPGRVLLLDRIRWDVLPDGPWPYIGTPSDEPTPAPNTSVLPSET